MIITCIFSEKKNYLRTISCAKKIRHTMKKSIKNHFFLHLGLTALSCYLYNIIRSLIVTRIEPCLQLLTCIFKTFLFRKTHSSAMNRWSMYIVLPYSWCILHYIRDKQSLFIQDWKGTTHYNSFTMELGLNLGKLVFRS